MKILYIGQYTEGTTSKMRADVIKDITKPDLFNIIDTHIPFHQTNRLWRSLGFRYKRGLLIKKVNKFILKELKNIKNYENDKFDINQQINKSTNQQFDLIWTDKSVFITKKTTKHLKTLTNKLVHFTPDPAFTFHKSRLFKSSLPLYDYAITTKAYELAHFNKYLEEDKIIYATQGFDKRLHKPLTPINEKKEGVLFIGHYETDREEIFQQLIDKGIPVTIAGIKWETFAKKNKTNTYLHYLGKGIYGKDYVKALSGYQFSWGALSKWMPELHTTRTFEIPACGTALITERNRETSSFFNEDEAIFHNTVDEMIEKIRYYQSHPNELETLTIKGLKRVHADGRDYKNIITGILKKINIIT